MCHHDALIGDNSFDVFIISPYHVIPNISFVTMVINSTEEVEIYTYHVSITNIFIVYLFE